MFWSCLVAFRYGIAPCEGISYRLRPRSFMTVGVEVGSCAKGRQHRGGSSVRSVDESGNAHVPFGRYDYLYTLLSMSGGILRS